MTTRAGRPTRRGLRERALCLRMIECERETEAHLPEPLEGRVFDVWHAARDAFVRDAGVQAYRQLAINDPIGPDDVELIAWMAIDPA